MFSPHNSREAGVARKKRNGKEIEWGEGQRRYYYDKNIVKVLTDIGLDKVENAHVYTAVGWGKLRLLTRHPGLLKSSNYKRWVKFAIENTPEVVGQAAELGKPEVPRDPRVAVMFRIPTSLRKK